MIDIPASLTPCQTLNQEANSSELVDMDAVSWAKKLFSRNLRKVQSNFSLVIRFEIVLIQLVAWLASSLEECGICSPAPRLVIPFNSISLFNRASTQCISVSMMLAYQLPKSGVPKASGVYPKPQTGGYTLQCPAPTLWVSRW